MKLLESVKLEIDTATSVLSLLEVQFDATAKKHIDSLQRNITDRVGIGKCVHLFLIGVVKLKPGEHLVDRAEELIDRMTGHVEETKKSVKEVLAYVKWLQSQVSYLDLLSRDKKLNVTSDVRVTRDAKKSIEEAIKNVDPNSKGSDHAISKELDSALDKIFNLCKTNLQQPKELTPGDSNGVTGTIEPSKASPKPVSGGGSGTNTQATSNSTSSGKSIRNLIS